MRRFALTVLLLLAASAPTGAQLVQFTPENRAELERIDAYLNAIRTMKGSFVQIDPDGQVDQGTFALSKPGRMRFEYAPPASTLIVSDGSTVAVQNPKLRTIDKYPLSQTPLELILGDNIDLLHNHSIVGAGRQQDQFVVKARSRGGKAQGNISLMFSEPGLELRQWMVIDNQGLSTTVALQNVQVGADVSNVSFALPEKGAMLRKQSE
jgi:outer membrane lipoprotein-sorting protein